MAEETGLAVAPGRLLAVSEFHNLTTAMAAALDRLARRRVLVKAECLQVTGSFKARGAWAAISALAAAGRRAGAGLFVGQPCRRGIAWAAERHGAPAVILMPADAPR